MFKVALDDIGAVPAEQNVPLKASCGCVYKFVEMIDMRDGSYWALEVTDKRCNEHTLMTVYDASVAILNQEVERGKNG